MMVKKQYAVNILGLSHTVYSLKAEALSIGFGSGYSSEANHSTIFPLEDRYVITSIA